MKALYIAAAVFVALLFLGHLRVGIQIKYDYGGLKIWARLSVIHLLVYPKLRREKKSKTIGEKGAKEDLFKAEPSLLQKIGGALDYAQKLLPIALEAAGQFKRKLQIDRLRLKLKVGGSSDPADAAIRYGQANAVLGTLWYPLNKSFTIKDGTAKTDLDFDIDGMTIYAELALSIRIGQLLKLGVHYGVKGLQAFRSVHTQQIKKTQHRKAA